MPLYFHSWQYLVRWWLYHASIFSLLTIFGEGVITSWRYIFTPDNIWWGFDYIMPLYFHSWQYLVRVWLYHAIIFSLLTILMCWLTSPEYHIYTLLIWIIVGSDDGVLPVRRQAIDWTSDDFSSIRFRETLSIKMWSRLNNFHRQNYTQNYHL